MVAVRLNPLGAFDVMFFAVFGLINSPDYLQNDKKLPVNEREQPDETEYLFKLEFAIYLLLTIVVLKSLLTAMMTDSYQKIQVLLPIVLAYKKTRPV